VHSVDCSFRQESCINPIYHLTREQPERTSTVPSTRLSFGLQENEYAVKLGDLQRVLLPRSQSVARPFNGSAGVAVSACMEEEIDRNTGRPSEESQ
jgi:hypothetical protein